jgi:hypothetical protein
MRAIKLAVTLGIILIGVLVGGVGVVMWKISGGPVKPAQRSALPFTYNMELPDGARVITTSLDGDRLAVTIAHDGTMSVLILDLASGRILGRVELTPTRADPPPIIGG